MKTTASQYAQALHELSQEKSASDQTRLVSEFVDFLKRKGESKKLSRIVKKLEQLQDAQSGIVRVSVTTVFPIRDELMTELEAFAKKTFESKEVILNMQTDKKLLGGAVMKTDNHLIDISVSGRMKDMRKVLLK
jgi:F-type H+-transporting ATPase subunit delta